jgi:alpha-ketoglutarate-dependent 2,4-dichlorophenoxyacetate dioxygenase
MAFKVDPVTPEFVAVVSGVDLREPMTPDVHDSLIKTLDRYAVVVFHDQVLSQDELVAFARQIGPLDEGLQQKIMNRVQSRFKHDTISDISNLDSSGQVAARDHKQSIMNVGNQFWHSDSSYAHFPFRYSMLHGISVASWGGATEYADLRAAYDSLDERTKALIADRTGTFYSHNTRRWLGIQDSPQDMAAYPPVRWPLVRTHPGSGRKVLWVDSKVCEISGMPVHEGRALAHELIEHIGQRERVYAHIWKPNDLVVYDNRSCLHRGRRFDLTERREMRRVSTLEDVPSLGEVSLSEVA